MKSTLKDGGGKNLLFESTIFTGTLFGSINSCPKPGLQAISTAFSMALSLTFLSCLEIAAYTERGAWQTTKHSSSFGFFPIVGNLAWNCGHDIFLKILDRNSGSMWYPQSPCPGRSQQVYSSELKVKLKWEKTWKRRETKESSGTTFLSTETTTNFGPHFQAHSFR